LSCQLTVHMDSGKAVAFDPAQMRHFDRGYALTSYSSQGLTADRVLVNIDTNVHLLTWTSSILAPASCAKAFLLQTGSSPYT
jgi:hypothetical protein